MADIDQMQTTKVPGRNDPCPCGSGKKYKKCCGLKTGESALRVPGKGDIESGFNHYHQGDIAGALSIASKLVHVKPDLPEAHLLKGMCNYSQGKLSQAKEDLLQVDALSEKLQDKNNIPAYKLALATLEQELGNYENAEYYARDAISLGLNDSLTNNALGAALAAQEKFKEARSAFQKALGFDPMDAELWENLGNCNYWLIEYSEAVPCYKKAIELNPRLASAYRQLGAAYMDLSQFDAAIDQFQLYLNYGEEDAFITSNLAAACVYQGRLDEAYKWLTKSISLDADSASTYLVYGIYYHKKGEKEECSKMLHKALQLDPENVFLLTKILGIYEESCAFREREKLLIEFKKIENTETKNLGHLISALLRLNYTNTLSSAEMKRIHTLAGEYLSDLRASSEYCHEIARYSENSKIRIGYVSTDFRNHSVGYFIRNIIGSHDPDRFEVYCYADLNKHDSITDEIKSKSCQFRDITRISNESLAKLVYDDRIQILVDLGGYTARKYSTYIRLNVFTYKPAPIQITYLGYPNTTGMKAIDYRITDKLAEDSGGTLYTEKLLEMPESFLCFGNFPTQNIDPVPAFERNGHITFGSFNNVAKLTSEGIAVWSEILHRVKDSEILIKSQWLDQDITRENIFLEFERNGIDRKRINLQGYLKKNDDHLDMYNKIDIALDTFPYNGTTTTCQALWMGVPVVTLLGKKHTQRVSYSILKNIAHEELVAKNNETYIDIACKLASDRDSLQILKKQVPDDLKKSILCNPDKFTRQLEEIYSDTWDRFISGKR